MSFLLRRGIFSSIGGSEEFALNSATLNGTDQSFNLGADSSLAPSLEITLACWVDIPTVGNMRLVSKYNNTGTNRSYILQINASKHIRLLISDDGTTNPATTYSVEGTTALSDNTQYFLCATYDDTDFKVYVNGVLEGTLNGAGVTINAGLSDVHMGSSDQAVNLLDGDMCFGSIHNVGLTGTQVTTFYNGGNPLCWNALGSLKTGCVAYTRLSNWDGNTGGELTDQSGTGNDATNLNSTPFTGTGFTVECT